MSPFPLPAPWPCVSETLGNVEERLGPKADSECIRLRDTAPTPRALSGASLSGFSLELENHLRSPDLSLADNFEVTVWELADLKSFLFFSYAEIYFESFISEVLSKIEEHIYFLWRQTCREPCILQVPTLLPGRSSYSYPPPKFCIYFPLLILLNQYREEQYKI